MTLDYKEETWAELKAKGFWNYVLKKGIIGWGLPVGCFVFIFNLIMNLSQLSIYNVVKNFLVTLAIFSAGGIIFGVTMWFFAMKKE